MNELINTLKLVVNTLQHVKLDSTRQNLEYMLGAINTLDKTIADLERINAQEVDEDGKV